jgi:hypothetical protein
MGSFASRRRSGRSSTPMHSRSESTIARSMLFSSSRTLPGHAYSSSSRRASGRRRGCAVPKRALFRVRKWSRSMPDVLATLAQRGDHDGEHVDAVVEVLAEAPGLDLLGEVAVGGGEDAHVDLATSRVSPRRRMRSSWSTRSSFTWSWMGSSPISSRNNVPPLACSKRPGAIRARVGEGAFSCSRTARSPGASRGWRRS